MLILPLTSFKGLYSAPSNIAKLLKTHPILAIKCILYRVFASICFCIQFWSENSESIYCCIVLLSIQISSYTQGLYNMIAYQTFDSLYHRSSHIFMRYSQLHLLLTLVSSVYSLLVSVQTLQVLLYIAFGPRVNQMPLPLLLPIRSASSTYS